MIAWANDPEAADAYPIVTYTWLICYKKYPDKNKLQAMQDLVRVRTDRRPEGRGEPRLHSAARRASSPRRRPRSQNLAE